MVAQEGCNQESYDSPRELDQNRFQLGSRSARGRRRRRRGAEARGGVLAVENARCAAREGAAEARRAPTMAPNFQVKFLDSKFTKTGILDRKMRFWT